MVPVETSRALSISSGDDGVNAYFSPTDGMQLFHMVGDVHYHKGL